MHPLTRRSVPTARHLRAVGGPRHSAAPRAGFTLIELVVAMSFLTVGLLAVAGLALTAIRATKRGAAQTLAAAVAQSRIDSLSGLPCAAIVPTGSGRVISGTATYRGIVERWSVRDAANGNMHALTDSLTVPGRAGPIVFLSMRACR